ncbi:Carboxypeptidase S1 [Aspergillus sp. HF37]|nr:Carboxypeptidase S1 [Aspergillus sp. HF37]
MIVGGREFGETRQVGNLSFTRVYQAGHEVPFYQPVPALQLFNRTLFGWDAATGSVRIGVGGEEDGGV